MLEIHPATAAALGVADGDQVRLHNERGECWARATFSRSIRRDTVFLPFHFPDRQRANLLTTDATDPISGMPEFKVAAVRVERVDQAPRHDQTERVGVAG
jgi:assimilatory nitrate reductase catalytic subunit